MIVIFDYLFGKVIFKINSSSPETIINILRHSISLKNIIKADNNTITFETISLYKKQVFSVCKKHLSNAEIISESGIPVLYKKYSGRFGIILGIVCSVFMIYNSSKLIWQINVTGNEYVNDSEIVAALKDLGVCEGVKKRPDALEDIYNSFLIKENRISWISINFDGTVANVNVKETKIVPEKTDMSKIINIIASCDGIIKRVDALSGTKEVNNGDAVKKGELLISSFINSEKSGTVVRAAKGSVWASTIHNFDIFVPKVLYERIYNTDKHNYSIKILGKEISFNLNNKNTDTVRVFEKESRAKINNSIHLPFTINKKKIVNSSSEKVNVDIQNAKKIASVELSKRINQDIPDADIIEQLYNVSETEEGYMFSYELKCIENIAKLVEH